MEQITKKKYLKVKFKPVSSLSIGTGKGENTDSDILRNSKGDPYIPGTSIAGVVRSLLQEKYNLSDNDIKNTFGYVKINTDKDSESKKEDIIESNIIFYDANIKNDTDNNNADDIINVTIRDSVALDDYKNAKPGAKFDMEVLEPHEQLSFETFIEFNFTDNNDETMTETWKKIIALLKSEDIRFGKKTTRGLGTVEIKVAWIKKKEFDFGEESSDISAWLEFDIYDAESTWDSLKEIDKEYTSNNKDDAGIADKIKLELALRLRDGISIRKYSTEEDAPDYAQLTVGQNPVIPGTTWAGAFRHRIEEILKLKKDIHDKRDEILKKYFGKAGEDEKDKVKSRIIFSETIINNTEEKILTRTAIDRFTGGAAEGSLYTEKTYYPKQGEYGGNTTLTIGLNNISVEKEDKLFLCALFAAIADLHGGYLSIGGLTSVGRGLFYIKEITGYIRGKEVNIDSCNAGEIYNSLKEVLYDEHNNQDSNTGGEL